MARYRKCLPSGRKNGQRWEVCCVKSSFVTGTGVPPPAFTRISGDCVLAEKRITPSAPHAPPRPKGASATTCTEPLKSTVFNLPSAKNPSDRLSGDQKGKTAFSLPDRMCASNESIGRTHIAVLPSDLLAVKASMLPSGDKTGGPAESPVRLSVVPSGGLMTVRITGAGGPERLINTPIVNPNPSAIRKLNAHQSGSCLRARLGMADIAMEELLVVIHCRCSFRSCAV